MHYEKKIGERVILLEENFKFLSHLIQHIQHNQEHIMATVQEVKDAILAEKTQVQEKLAAVAVEIQALKDQIAAGGGATTAQMDELMAAIKEIFTPDTAPTP